MTTYVTFPGDALVHKVNQGADNTACGVSLNGATPAGAMHNCFDCDWVMLAQHGAGPAATDATGVVRTSTLGPVVTWHLARRQGGVNGYPQTMCDSRSLSPSADRKALDSWNSADPRTCRDCDRTGRSRGII